MNQNRSGISPDAPQFVSDIDRETHAFLLARGYRYAESVLDATYYYRRFTAEESDHWNADKCQLVLKRYDWSDFPQSWEDNPARVAYEMDVYCEAKGGFAVNTLLYGVSPTNLASRIDALEEAALSVWRLLSRKDRREEDDAEGNTSNRTRVELKQTLTAPGLPGDTPSNPHQCGIETREKEANRIDSKTF